MEKAFENHPQCGSRIDAYSGSQGQDNPKDIKKNTVIPWAGLRRRGLRSAWSMAMDASPNVWVVRGPCPVESIAAYERTLKKDNGPTDIFAPTPYFKKRWAASDGVRRV